MSKAKSPSRKLKVFVTAIGFHDAYVAAPSRKAALAAWGSTHDLFARGVASEVTDPELAREPLSRPGEVVKRVRGTREEQLAALGEASSALKKRKAAPAVDEPARPTAPDTHDLEAAKAALRQAEDEAARSQAAIARERAALAAREEQLHHKTASDRARLQEAVAQAEADLARRQRRYDRELAAFEEARKERKRS